MVLEGDQMNRKPQGWKNESARHSLASRGVKTSGFQSRTRILPIYRFRDVKYYRDDRLREFRNVDNPHDVIPFDCYEGRVLQMKTSGRQDITERVNIHGMDVSRWRCPRCHRGLRGGDTCSIHGRIPGGEGVDIIKSPRAQDYAIYYRVTNELSKQRSLSVKQLAKRIGIDELILIEHLDKIDPYDGRTYRESYMEDFDLKSSGRMIERRDQPYDFDYDFDYDFKEEWEREHHTARGDPIVIDIKGRGSFDGDLRISLEGAEELLPLLQSRGVAMQAISAFNSSSGTQKIEGRIKGVDVDVKVTHPGEDLYHVEGDMGYHIDRTFTRKELKGFYSKVKELM